MDSIFHEKQDGSLCAQHCLNALLQGPYYTAVDLASLAQELDEAERKTMEEGDRGSPEYIKFLQQPSSNMDDSGFFSIQVINNALRVWRLDLIPMTHPDVAIIQQDPRKAKAFICNYREHWLCIRKIGQQWFNLNSLLSGPELLSETYLSVFLAQLRHEGYSIFVVSGVLPECEADHVLELCPVVQTSRPALLPEYQKQKAKPTPAPPSSSPGPSGGGRPKSGLTMAQLNKALEANQGLLSTDTELNGDSVQQGASCDDDDLAKAISLSLAAESDVVSSTKPSGGAKTVPSSSGEPGQADVEMLRQDYYTRNISPHIKPIVRDDSPVQKTLVPENSPTTSENGISDSEEDDDEVLQQALRMSLEADYST